MKKRIALVMALAMAACSFAACGNTTESTAEPATEAVTEAETEESTEIVYIEDFSICGTYVCDRAKLDVTSNDGKGFFITIIWGANVAETAEWDATGKLDENHVLHYEGCRMQHVTYAENGEAAETEVVYSDGDGTLVFTEAGVEWHDNKEDAGKGMLFTPAPEEETEEETTEAATEEETTEAATEGATEAATEAAEEETNAPLVGIFEGTYVEKNAGRGVITITNNMDDTYTVEIKWSESAFANNEWKFSGEFNGRQVLEYENAEKIHTEYGEDGNPTTDADGNETPYFVYKDGTGFLKLTDEGLYWTDNKEHIADDTLFVKQ